MEKRTDSRQLSFLDLLAQPRLALLRQETRGGMRRLPDGRFEWDDDHYDPEPYFSHYAAIVGINEHQYGCDPRRVEWQVLWTDFTVETEEDSPRAYVAVFRAKSDAECYAQHLRTEFRKAGPVKIDNSHVLSWSHRSTAAQCQGDYLAGTASVLIGGRELVIVDGEQPEVWVEDAA